MPYYTRYIIFKVSNRCRRLFCGSGRERRHIPLRGSHLRWLHLPSPYYTILAGSYVASEPWPSLLCSWAKTSREGKSWVDAGLSRLRAGWWQICRSVSDYSVERSCVFLPCICLFTCWPHGIIWSLKETTTPNVSILTSGRHLPPFELSFTHNTHNDGVVCLYYRRALWGTRA